MNATLVNNPERNTVDIPDYVYNFTHINELESAAEEQSQLIGN